MNILPKASSADVPLRVVGGVALALLCIFHLQAMKIIMNIASKSTSVHATLSVAGRTALALLGVFYLQAFLKGDLRSDSNWTISRIMAYPYNEPISILLMLPTALTITTAYAYKREEFRIRAGSALAVVGWRNCLNKCCNLF